MCYYANSNKFSILLVVFFIFLEVLFFAAPGAEPVVAFVRCVADRPPLAAGATREVSYLFIKIERFLLLFLLSEHSRTIVPLPASRATFTFSSCRCLVRSPDNRKYTNGIFSRSSLRAG